MKNGLESQLNPAPRSPVQALLLVGGNSRAAARRAARFHLAFAPAVDDPALARAYRDACAEYDFAHGSTVFPGHPATTLISEDPDRSWREIGDYLLFDARAYGAWRHPNRRAYAESAAGDLGELKAEGKYRILTPTEAVRAIRETGSLHLAPLCGGVPSEIGWRSLELFESKVQPLID